MGNKYKHLTRKDRVFLSLMLEKRYSKAKIAKILKVDSPTIHRKIKRNSITHWPSKQRYYWVHSAQEAALKRKKRGLVLEKDALLLYL